jgi:hypothetical protein
MGLWVPTDMEERYSAAVRVGMMRQAGRSLPEGTAR